MVIIPAAVSASAAEYALCDRTGLIHSVYRNTVNLSLDGRLIALQAAGSPKSALSIILPLNTDEMALTRVSAGRSCRIREGVLTLDPPDTGTAPIRIPLREDLLPPECVFPVAIPAFSRDGAQDIYKNTLTMLEGADGFARIFTGSGDKDDPVLVYAGRVMDNTRALLSAGITGSVPEITLGNAAAELRRLIGLGTGLTPSGDDFLCGVLSVLYAFGIWDGTFAKKLRTEIFQHLEDTNAISAAFLRSSLQGECSEAVRLLFQAHFPLSAKESERIRGAFSEIGHSSGTDSLCGICYISKLLWEELI